MTLLKLEHVSKRHNSGVRDRVALRDVSLELDSGELVAIWGMRRSGRSTLLRVAAGVEPPDTGVVRLGGRDLADHRGDVLGGEIGYCQKVLRPAEGRTILEDAIMGLLARGVSPSVAQARAWGALERAGAERCAALRPNELDGAETVRVAIARTLANQPKLLVIDEPTLGVGLLARDGILVLLRSLADEGTAVLTSTGESTGLSGADRALSLGGGELSGSLAPELAPVVTLRRPAAGTASA
jgi:putative ABC transport system ATP-binding protein